LWEAVISAIAKVVDARMVVLASAGDPAVRLVKAATPEPSQAAARAATEERRGNTGRPNAPLWRRHGAVEMAYLQGSHAAQAGRTASFGQHGDAGCLFF
jgi:hypothetical protein